MAILQNTTVSGSLVVTGDLTARQFILSSSVTFFTESFASGSTRFGDSMDDTMVVTGSLRLTGSLATTGSATFKVNADRNLAIKYDTNVAISAQNDAGNPESVRYYADTFRIYTATTAVGLTERLTISNTGAVGIGITNPGAGLEIATNGSSLNAIRSTTTQAYNAGPETSIVFRYKHNTAGDYTSGALINTAKDNTTDGNQSGNLQFWTNNAGTAAERMRITSAGNVGIGTTNPDGGKLRVEGGELRVTTTNLGVALYRTSNNGEIAAYNWGGGAFVPLSYQASEHIFTASSTERMRIFASGNVRFSSQVYGNTVASPRTLYIQSDGELGGVSSIRESKKNIENVSNINWIYQLNPVSFNYRKKDEEGNYTEEIYDEINYGLIAEDTAPVADFLINYNDKEDSTKEMVGIEYMRLITPMLKAIQELKAENDSLKEILTRNNIS
jgi:hypothetical protein